MPHLRRQLAVTLALAGVCATVASATNPTRYTSTRYHYSLVPPAHWVTAPATANLAAGFFPDGAGAATDKFQNLADPQQPEIGIAAAPLRPGTTLQKWLATTRAAIVAQYACVAQGPPGRRILDGQPADILIYDSCVGLYFIEVATVVHGRGYDVYWLSNGTKSAATRARDRAAFNWVLATLRFTG